MMSEIRERLIDLLAKLPFRRFRDPPPVVGVLRFDGVIGGTPTSRGGISLASHERAIQSLFAPRRIRAAAIIINSPGGRPAQCSLIARRVRDLAKEKNIPVIAFCEDVAASGGYWLACAGDEIFVDTNSIVGSIGVIHAGFGFTDLLDRVGIERRVHVTGERKGMLDPFSDEKPEDVDRLKEIQNEIFSNFREYVRERRGARLASPDDDLYTGDIWLGRQAQEIGLVDGIGDYRSEMRRRFGDKVRFHRVAVKRGLLSRFRGGLRVTVEPADLIAALETWWHTRRFGL